MPALAKKGRQIFVAAVFALDAGKALVQIAAIEIPIDYLLDIGPPEPMQAGKSVVIDLYKDLEIIL